MGKYEIKLVGAKSVYDIHERIQEGLKFPDYYGKNLDALWDCLTDMEAPIEIYIHGVSKIGREMKEFFTEKIIKIFNEAKAWFGENEETFEFVIYNQETHSAD